MMKKRFLIFALVLLGYHTSFSQCEIIIDAVDEFDSTKVISAQIVSFGYLVPSNFETVDGPLLIEEAKMLFSYTESDSINAFIMTIAVPEFKYQPVESGFNVLFKMSDSTVVEAVYNVPSKGVFDKRINMQVYQHALIIPFELFFRLTEAKIEKIRINYPKQKRTFHLSEEQQQAVLEAIRCVGEASGYYPLRP
ncbi:MAG: hypothetical protein KDC85_04060 [Saprospiraceae bacterium]|nr:hypothetical protein [Saprospiraceae bacterium]MCB9324056.1 hypothetical protein [Lewinellaceae bacterium]